MPFSHRLLALLALSLAFPLSPAAAQPFGTYSWQLQPFCNRVTVTIHQTGTIYSLDGFDDQCGAPQRAPVVGTVVLNPDGTAGFGFTVVTTPGGRAVHVEARVNPANGSGTWSDSAGNSGPFALGAATGGAERRLPTGAPAPGSFIDVSGATLAGPYGFGVIVTSPTVSDGAAFFAQWGEAPTASIPTPSAVRGVSRDYIGVAGVSTGGVGVFGGSSSGEGVTGISSVNAGVSGFSGNGPGVRATSLSPGLAIALDLGNGGIRVGGTVRPAFQHTATAGTISGNLTRLDHPLLNDNPAAMVYVTHVYGPGSNVYVPAVGVYFDPVALRWTIYREDLGAMPANAAFNVLVVIQ